MTSEPSKTMPGVMWAYLFWGIMIGLPLSVVAIGASFFAQSKIRSIASLPHDGAPAAIEGTLAGPARITPMGAPVSGWMGVVHRSVRSGKSSVGSTLCTLTELEGLTLGGNAIFLEREPHVSEDSTEVLTTLPGEKSMVLGSFAESETMPADVLARCDLPPLGARETRTWIEHRFPAGATATFIGCRNEDHLAACREKLPGNGSLVLGGRRALVRRLLSANVSMTALMLLIALFFSMVAAVATLVHLRPYLGKAIR